MATPIDVALASIGGHTNAIGLAAAQLADGGTATRARPHGGAAAVRGAIRAITTIPAGTGTHGCGAIGIKPARITLAGIRLIAGTAIQTLLSALWDAARGIRGVAGEARDAGAGVRPGAYLTSVGQCHDSTGQAREYTRVMQHGSGLQALTRHRV